MYHDAWKKVRWDFYEGQKYPWWEQCVECSSKTEKRFTYLMFMLGLMKPWFIWWWQRMFVGMVICCGERGWSCLERALDFEVEGQGNNERLKMTWKRQVVEERAKVSLWRENSLCRSMWIVGEMSYPGRPFTPGRIAYRWDVCTFNLLCTAVT